MENTTGERDTVLTEDEIREQAIKEERERQAARRREIARMGGKSTARKLGKDHYRKIAQKGLQARWNKDKKDGTN